MQHAPINDPARHRLQEVGVGDAPEEVREVGVHDFRMATKQQLLHLYGGLLGVAPGAVGVEFRWKVPPPALPGFSGTTSLSATPAPPARPSRPSGRSSRATPRRFPSCRPFPSAAPPPPTPS